MVRAEVYRSDTGYEAKSITTGTQKGRNKTPKIDGTHHFIARRNLKLLANHLVTYAKTMRDDGRWKPFEDRLEITFPRDLKIFHPLSGESRVLYPLSKVEVEELWEYIKYYSERAEVCYED